MKMKNLAEYLAANSYPGRGILIGQSPTGRAVIAYFIMGRSVNSRNRVFVTDGDGIKTQAFDASKLTDPSLIIYSPVRVTGGITVVTNGDQTDTVYDAVSCGGSFEDALRTREYEPDEPNFTPRISGITDSADGRFTYKLSILKKGCSGCDRFFYEYKPAPGVGHIIHTYDGDGSPIPSFTGEPVAVDIDSSIDVLTSRIWNSLNTDNKVSLFVRYIDIHSSLSDTKIINKNR